MWGDRRFALPGAALLLLLCAACGPTTAGTPPAGDGGVPDRPVSADGPTAGDAPAGFDAPDVVPEGSLLVVQPADATISVAAGAGANLDYRVTLRSPGTYDIDVTGEATFALDDLTLGAFTGNRFSGAIGAVGATTVRATAHGLTGATGLTLRVQSVVVGPGAPADAAGRFGGAVDAGRSPALVYPPAGVLVPPNLNEFQFHFTPGAGNTLFWLAFREGPLAVDVYFGCTPLGGGCLFVPDETTWTILSQTFKGRDAVSITLKGVDGASPGAVGAAPAQTILFSEEDILGGLYYWNAGAGAVRRYDFGRRGQSAENYLNRAKAGAATCVGCHVLSNDGRRIAAGLDMPSPSPYKVFDVATRDVVYAQGSMFGGGANFFTFSPDATQIMTSNGISLVWRDAATGAALKDPVVPVGTMPDWSPDGTKLVFTRSTTPPPCIGICGAPGVDKAGLSLLSFDGTTWSAPAPLVPYAGQNNYYPAFSPDGQWIMFNRSPGDKNSYDAPDAEVWVVRASGGTPIRLARASTGGDSWPKWAGKVQTYRGKPLLWLTFSSRRAFGLALAAGTRAQLWMAAFDPEAAAAGGDGSYPAFWLPFQEPGSGNHIAQWVTEVVRKPCGGDPECEGGEFCEMGRCVPGLD
ncbi:MAG TPA: hypothetical protein VGQ83_20825 [Polyangia bacterium]|jgi:hypothetical protein